MLYQLSSILSLCDDLLSQFFGIKKIFALLLNDFYKLVSVNAALIAKTVIKEVLINFIA